MSLGVTDQEVRVVDDPTVIKVAEKLGKNPSTNTNCGAGNLPPNPHHYGVGAGLVLVDGVGLPSLLIY